MPATDGTGEALPDSPFMADPLPIASSAFVVAAFDQARPRFLTEGQRSPWVVVVEPERAKRFVDIELARKALAQYDTPHRRSFSDPGDWHVYAIATLNTFSSADELAARPPGRLATATPRPARKDG